MIFKLHIIAIKQVKMWISSAYDKIKKNVYLFANFKLQSKDHSCCKNLITEPSLFINELK